MSVVTTYFHEVVKPSVFSLREVEPQVCAEAALRSASREGRQRKQRISWTGVHAAHCRPTNVDFEVGGSSSML